MSEGRSPDPSGPDSERRRWVDRIERRAHLPGLLDGLAGRLPGADLQSLLLAVFQRRARAVRPAELLEQYGRDRMVEPSPADPSALAALDLLAYSLLPEGHRAIELSPVCPLGANSAVATIDQNRVVTTIRNTEVTADSTSALALECALRRRRIRATNPRSSERVGLATSQRVLRPQRYASSSARSHFRLLALATAGRDVGSLGFEMESLLLHLTFYVSLLGELRSRGAPVGRVEVALTDLAGGRAPLLEAAVLEPLASRFPGVACSFEPSPPARAAYYETACLHVRAGDGGGAMLELVDGGLTGWTRRLLSDTKERLMISGMGAELVVQRFPLPR
ncbi:MAG TPA: hypothetical protein VIA06_09960 [Candidatus Dormibacteraeota bacterium]|nr:hypothetical protein [Candidatus Dormibacteraeota bacterium]